MIKLITHCFFDKKIQKNNVQLIFYILSLILLLTNFFITMAQGTVKFFNDSKGFGFITEDGSDTDHFVHISGLIDEVREGDIVEFDLQEGRKGMNAVNVKVV